MNAIAIAASCAALVAGCAATDPSAGARDEAAVQDRQAKQTVTGSNIPRKPGAGAGTVGVVDPSSDPNAMQQVQDALKNSGGKPY